MLSTLLFLLSLSTTAFANTVCKDNNGKNVDWYIFYKLPKLKTAEADVDGLDSGVAMLYMDSNKRSWVKLDHGIDTNKQAVYYTLQQYYEMDSSKTFSMMYNDEWPDSSVWSEDSGHCKGVTVFDESSGFWLIHSVPRFPSNNTYSYPSNAYRYAQHGLCVSFSYSALNDISTQLFYIDPYTYQINLPPKFENKFPTLLALKNGKSQKTEPYISQKVLKSRGGHAFKHFGKAGGFGKDLYFDLVAPSLKTSLKVETWQHGKKINLDSECNPNNENNVLNVKTISLPFSVTFDNYQDHSKFAVAYTSQARSNAVPYVCIGDINRQQHQLQRGGGTMCIFDFSVHNAYSTLVSGVDECEK